MSKSKQLNCPDCKGTGELKAIFPHWADYVPVEERSPVIFLPCPRCEGSGKVPTEMFEWIKKGKDLKEKRRNKHLTLRKAARMLRMEMLVLLAMENGHVNPDMNIGYDLPVMTGKK